MTEVFTWPVGRAVESEYGGRTTGTPLRYVLTYVVFATAGGALTGFALAAVGSPGATRASRRRRSGS